MADLVYPGATPGGPLNSGAMPANNDLVIYKGDYVEIFVTVKNSGGTAINLTGYTAKAQLKSNYSDATPDEFACTIPTPTNGQVRIYLSSAQSTALVPGDYIWDFQLTSGGGDTRTYLAGDVTVYPEVTT